MMSDTRKQTYIAYILSGALLAAVVVLTAVVIQMNQKLNAMTVHATAPAPATTEHSPIDSANDASAEEPGEWKTYPAPMASEPWDPFGEMERMQTQIDRIFGETFHRFGRAPSFSSLLEQRTFSPRFDLVDQGDAFVATVEIPGAEESEISVELQGQTLNVSATTATESSTTQGGNSVIHRERHVGSFQRGITLPEPVDGASIETAYEDGVLTVTIDKATRSEST